MLMKKHKLSLKDDQRGIASIVICVFVILILSLVVLDMSRDASREQRQSLDHQLSSQAFYAAESGINDTVRYITETNDHPPHKRNCDPLQGQNQIPGFSNQLGDSISYTCVMYETRLENLEYNNVTPAKSQIIPIEVTGASLDSLEISWKAKDNDVPAERVDARTFSGCPSGTFINGSGTRFPTAPDFGAHTGNNCDAGFIRVELVDTRPGIGRNVLIDNSFVGFMVPRGGGSVPEIPFTDGKGNNKGIVREARCLNNTGECTVKITGLNLAPGERMYLRIGAVYKSPTLEINGEAVPSPSGSTENLRFVNAQMLVDVTGKASDVLKRMQVRVPLGYNSTYEEDFRFPELAIQADSICKRLQLLPPASGNSVDECN